MNKKTVRRPAVSPRCCPELARAASPALFKALSDETRLHILLCLASCPCVQPVSAIAGCCSVDMSVVSRHLAVLRRAGVVDVQRQGKLALYSVRREAFAGSLRALADAIEGCVQ